MKHSIEDYQTLCRMLRSAFSDPQLIISAGCLRDTLSDVPVKDIDVFTECYENEGMESTWAEACKSFALFAKGTVTFREPPEDYPNIYDLCDIETPRYGLIQIIAIQKVPIDDVPNYDFGLSQVFVTGNGLFFSENALHDRQNQTITFTPSDHTPMAMERSRLRYNRLKEKYQDWKFLNCEILEAMNNATP